MSIKFSSGQVSKILDTVDEVCGDAIEAAYRAGVAAGKADAAKRVNTLIKLGTVEPEIKRQLVFASLVLLEE